MDIMIETICHRYKYSKTVDLVSPGTTDVVGSSELYEMPILTRTWSVVFGLQSILGPYIHGGSFNRFSCFRIPLFVYVIMSRKNGRYTTGISVGIIRSSISN